MDDGLGSSSRPLRRRGCRSQGNLRTAEDRNLARCERAAGGSRGHCAGIEIFAAMLRLAPRALNRVTCPGARAGLRGAKANVDRAQISRPYGDADGLAVDTLYHRAGDDQRAVAT